MNIPETDQWLLTGECNKCRRLSYCKKKCGAYKRESTTPTDFVGRGLREQAPPALKSQVD